MLEQLSASFGVLYPVTAVQGSPVVLHIDGRRKERSSCAAMLYRHLLFVLRPGEIFSGREGEGGPGSNLG